MPEPLNEAALRRPEFTGGHEVELADGQTWVFPKPVMRWFPAPGPDGKFQTKRSDPYGPEYQAELERFFALGGDDPAAASARADLQMSLAASLLTRNYDLPADAYERLLPMDGTDRNGEMWTAIRSVLVGVSPSKKPGAVGSE